ncbi:hypothetical protein Sjap_024987 [Stephania japonica]|uniref:Uncharacterized protein n=1 Tax=Stephania japonica TaxID=461633 RepID=A0AAP0E0Z0_9MAGN
MDEKQHEVPTKLNIVVPKLNLKEINKQINKASASSSPVASPRHISALVKQSSVRMSCLCAPTTHAGSFRCRLHRKPGLTRNGASLGSNLYELGSKSSTNNIRS